MGLGCPFPRHAFCSSVLLRKAGVAEEQDSRVARVSMQHRLLNSAFQHVREATPKPSSTTSHRLEANRCLSAQRPQHETRLTTR